MVYPKQENSKIESIIDFKKIFLLEFTRELIKHSSSGEVSQLKNIVNEEIEEKKKEIKR